MSDLASECTVDKELLLRLMRLLAARGFVEEVGLENYRNAPFGLFLVQDEGAAGGLRSMYFAISSPVGRFRAFGVN